MNRDMTHASGPNGHAAVRQHVLGLYELIDGLRRSFPTLEIETCASGGARADLGILRRTDRIWVSDCIDPLERQRMHRALLTFLPPELLGMHIGSAHSHTTTRVASIGLRSLTALLGHPGIEADPARFSDEDAQHVRAALAFFKAERHWLAGAGVSALDHDDPAIHALSAIAADARRALVTVVATDRLGDAVPASLRIPGLHADVAYRVTVHPLWSVDARHGKQPAGPYRPAGGTVTGVTLHGRTLQTAGIALPILPPGSTLLLVCDQVDHAAA